MNRKHFFSVLLAGAIAAAAGCAAHPHRATAEQLVEAAKTNRIPGWFSPAEREAVLKIQK